MKPIPSEIVTRWSPMWAKDCCPDRPWWRREYSTLVRVDGIGLYSQWTLDQRGGDPRGLWDGKEPYEDAIARIDAAHPLPAPPPMPGQVWVYPDGCENLYLFHTPNGAPRVPGRLESERPPPGAILVAGPTPWGRDIPWGPA